MCEKHEMHLRITSYVTYVVEIYFVPQFMSFAPYQFRKKN
jgi:hypothetical protein